MLIFFATSTNDFSVFQCTFSTSNEENLELKKIQIWNEVNFVKKDEMKFMHIAHFGWRGSKVKSQISFECLLIVPAGP